MRAVISLLLLSMVMGSLALNCKGIINPLSRLLLALSSGDELVLATLEPNQTENPLPHRGSGRKELRSNRGNVYLAV